MNKLFGMQKTLAETLAQLQSLDLIVRETLKEQNTLIPKISDEELLKAADHINFKFQEASIRKDKRATIVATMLLSLLSETEPNYNDIPDVFVDDTNSRAKDALEANGKEKFFKYLEDQNFTA